MRDYSAVFLRNAWKKSGHVLKCNQRNIEAVAEPDEPSGFDRSTNIQNSREKHWLVCNDADRLATKSPEADAYVLRIQFLHFKEVSIVDYMVYYFANVVWLIRSLRNDAVEFRLSSIGRIACFHPGCVFHVV